MNREILQPTCPNCGAAISGGGNFCDSCGAPLTQQQQAESVNHQQQLNICSVCGQPLEPGAAFCGNCGAKLS